MVLNETDAEATSSRWKMIGKNPFFTSTIEIAFALIISNAAVFISIFVALLISKEQSANLLSVTAQTFRTSIKTTEIVVYILGFLAPVMWTMVTSIRAWRHFGFLLILIGIQFIVIISTSLIYALSIANVLNNQALANRWAWWSLLIALAVWYATLVYDKKVLRNVDELIARPKPGKESGTDVLASLRGE